MKSILAGLVLSLMMVSCKTVPKNAYNIETLCIVNTVINNEIATLYYTKTEYDDYVRVGAHIEIPRRFFLSYKTYDLDSEEAKTGKILVKTDNYFFAIFTSTSTPDKSDFAFEVEGPTVRGLMSFKTKDTECKVTKREDK